MMRRLPSLFRRPPEPAACPYCHLPVDLLRHWDCPHCARSLVRLRTPAQQRRAQRYREAADRRAISGQANAAAGGLILLVIGLAAAGSRLSGNVTYLRVFVLCAAVSAGVIGYRLLIGEPVHRTLLVFGVLWLLAAMLLIAFA